MPDDTPSSPSPTSTHNPRRGRIVAASVLLAVAAVVLVDRYTDIELRRHLTLLLGAGFLVWSLFGRVWGLLVPAGIMLGVGAGLWLELGFRGDVLPRGAGFLLGLAAGWLLIPLFSAIGFKRRVLWPLWPAAGILVGAVLQIRRAEFQEFLRIGQDWWPWVLIVVAIALLALPRPRP